MAETEAGTRGERIGEFLTKIGAMQTWQVDAVLRTQSEGDRRTFGEIAIERGLVDDAALRRYVEAHALLAAGRQETERRPPVRPTTP